MLGAVYGIKVPQQRMRTAHSRFIDPYMWKTNFILLFIKQGLLLLIANLLLACNANAELPQNLKERIAYYYSLEKNNRWEMAYEVRDPNFRQSVEKKYYVTEMRQDNQGWKLEKYEIMDWTKEKNKAVIRIRFSESPSEQYRKTFHVPKDTKELSFDDVTKWINIDGTWYCHDAGKRLHLTLNGSIN